MHSSSQKKRNLYQNTLAAITVFGLTIFWWKPILAWLLAGLVSSGLLLEVDRIRTIVRSPDARMKMGGVLMGNVALIVFSSWRLFTWWM